MKIKTYLLVFIMLFTGLSSTQAAYVATKHMTYEQKVIRAQEIKQRVAEIKAMDMSQLTTAERKDLRHELKDMRKEMRDPTYIYISGGALLLIIILLILLV